MKTLRAKKLNIRKAARFAAVVNALQIIAMLGVIAYVLLSGGEGRYVELGVLLIALLIVGLGAVLDIREALNAEHIADQAVMLEDAYGQLEQLNGTLRKQRHDFTNHLQVVYSLMEMREYAEAMQYVESVYDDVRKTGSMLRTANPAVNALIAAKRADCEERGIRLDAEFSAAWQDLPVPGWEMCRVLGNLIDNARDALIDGNTPSPAIRLEIGETPGAFTFSVINNGPAIAPDCLGEIFRLGYTTKREGHGSGLSIVKDILSAHGGDIRVASSAAETRFSGSIPRKAAVEPAAV